MQCARGASDPKFLGHGFLPNFLAWPQDATANFLRDPKGTTICLRCQFQSLRPLNSRNHVPRIPPSRDASQFFPALLKIATPDLGRAFCIGVDSHSPGKRTLRFSLLAARLDADVTETASGLFRHQKGGGTLSWQLPRIRPSKTTALSSGDSIAMAPCVKAVLARSRCSLTRELKNWLAFVGKWPGGSNDSATSFQARLSSRAKNSCGTPPDAGADCALTRTSSNSTALLLLPVHTGA